MQIHLHHEAGRVYIVYIRMGIRGYPLAMQLIPMDTRGYAAA